MPAHYPGLNISENFLQKADDLTKELHDQFKTSQEIIQESIKNGLYLNMVGSKAPGFKAKEIINKFHLSIEEVREVVKKAVIKQLASGSDFTALDLKIKYPLLSLEYLHSSEIQEAAKKCLIQLVRKDDIQQIIKIQDSFLLPDEVFLAPEIQQEVVNLKKSIEFIGEEVMEKELSPKVIEIIMRKIQDLDTEYTPYSVIGQYKGSGEKGGGVSTDLSIDNYVQLNDILKDGLLGSSYEDDDIKSDLKRKEIWLKNIRKIKNARIVYFNIVSRTADAKEIKRNVNDLRTKLKLPSDEILEMGYNTWGSLGKIYLIFDLVKFKEARHYKKQEINTFRIEVEHSRKNDLPITNSVAGFTLANRIAPRFFRGIVIQDKVGFLRKKELENSTMRQMVENIATIMKRVYSNKKELLIPIYDIEGNLLWPKLMSHEEIKKINRNENIS
ncbi:MAG TPA: hypothetical protein VJK01_02355 [Candidatus Paceibacterota bacterium]